MMIPLEFLALLCMSLGTGLRSSYAALVLEGPNSITVALGQTATFKCVAQMNVTRFTWFVNGTEFNPQDDIGITISSIIGSHVNATTEFNVDTTYGYNSTTFKCIARVTKFDKVPMILDEENSSTALLIIQGQLAAPLDVSASASTCDTVSLRWIDPYFLPDVPILSYQIILNGTLPEAEVSGCNAGSDIQSNGGMKTCAVTVGKCQDPCVPVNVTLAGVNEVGIGDPASTTFYFLGAPTFSSPRHSLLYSTVVANQLQLQVSVEKEDIGCVGRTPNEGEIAVNCYTQLDSEVTFENSYHFTPMLFGNTYTSTATGIPESLFCEYTISLSSTEHLITTSQEEMFSTHAIQTVQVQQTPGKEEVLTICTFLQGSQATGCRVILLCEGGAVQELTVFRAVGVITVTQMDTLTKLPSGTCDVEAYVINNNDDVSPNPAAFTTVEITIEQPSPTSTILASSALPTHTVVAIVIVLAVVIAVLIAVSIILVTVHLKRKLKVTSEDDAQQSQELLQHNGSRKTVPTSPDVKESKREDDEEEDQEDGKEEGEKETQGPKTTTGQPVQPKPGANEDISSDEDSIESSLHEERAVKWRIPSGPIRKRADSNTDVLRTRTNILGKMSKMKTKSLPRGGSLLHSDESDDESSDNEEPSLVTYELLEKEIGHKLCSKWLQLAPFLGLSPTDVYHIRMTYGGSDLDCMCHGVLRAWMLDHHPSWHTMVKALEEIGEHECASGLRSKYLEEWSQQSPSKEILEKVASEVGEKWMLIARMLGVPKFRVEQWQSELANNPHKCMSKAFMDWEKFHSRYNLATLLEVLEKPGINKHELAALIRKQVKACADDAASIGLDNPPSLKAHIQINETVDATERDRLVDQEDSED